MDKREKYLLRKSLSESRLREAQELQHKKDVEYMKAAVTQAKKAFRIGEVPIGCVIVHNDSIIARGYNRRNVDKSSLSHAELIAIRRACRRINDWRLEECTMYVTLEPCPMCAGAIIQARIPRVVIGCMNKKAGSVGSIINMFDIQEYNHHPDACYGIMEDVCSRLLVDFFKKLRMSKKEV